MLSVHSQPLLRQPIVSHGLLQCCVNEDGRDERRPEQRLRQQRQDEVAEFAYSVHSMRASGVGFGRVGDMRAPQKYQDGPLLSI